jgi:hypothetical protein
VLFEVTSSNFTAHLYYCLFSFTTNLAEAHQDKTPTTQLKSTTNDMALRMKIQTFSRKQDFDTQMHIKVDLDYEIQLWGCAQPKSTTNVMALRTKIQTFSGKQDFNIQMHIKADLDVWNSTMGMC